MTLRNRKFLKKTTPNSMTMTMTPTPPPMVPEEPATESAPVQPTQPALPPSQVPFQPAQAPETAPEHLILGSAGAALGAGEGQLELERKDSSCSSSSKDFLYRKCHLDPLVVEKLFF